jgi:hypothetical protein
MKLALLAAKRDRRCNGQVGAPEKKRAQEAVASHEVELPLSHLPEARHTAKKIKGGPKKRTETRADSLYPPFYPPTNIIGIILEQVANGPSRLFQRYEHVRSFGRKWEY